MSENITAHREAFNLLCESLIGQGAYRQVFDSKLLPEHVIKVETGAQSFANVIEWETWQRIKYTKHAKWFAPCLSISPCGLILVQAKTTPPHRFPTHVPAFLTDFQKANFGMYKGRFVCHDYGLNLLMENGMTSRMRRVKDWG